MIEISNGPAQADSVLRDEWVCGSHRAWVDQPWGTEYPECLMTEQCRRRVVSGDQNAKSAVMRQCGDGWAGDRGEVQLARCLSIR